MLQLTHPLILASGSTVRHRLLKNMGLPHQVVISPFDEEVAKQSQQGLTIPQLALQLAHGKAKAVSEHYPDHLVLGADQIGECEGVALFKPGNRQGNIRLLKQLQGKAHFQHTAACLYLNNKPLFETISTSVLTMRGLTEEAISTYVDEESPFDCCGGYQYEGKGKHLFCAVQGDVDSILGLPILAILNFLYEQNWLKMSKM